MPEGMLKTGRRAVYPGTDTPDRDNGKKPLSEYLYRAAVGLTAIPMEIPLKLF